MNEAAVDAELDARIVGRIGRITLNRPAALNALNLAMVEAMTRALLAWRADPSVAAVVVDGAGGKAFCAGGDIRLLAESGTAKDGRAEIFWREEYRLNALIAEYPKPYVALIDGIVMGGGVGVSVHGRFRVAGGKTTFAMPETGIGFHPDVGGSFFLPRLPHRAGFWMGLSGARLKAADCVRLGVATSFTPSEQHPALLAALEAAVDAVGVSAALDRFAADPGPPPFDDQREAIERCYGALSAQGVIDALERDGSAWAKAQLERLAGKSPTALKVTFESLRRGAGLSLRACLAQELALSVRGLDKPDFYEGVRAVIVDKDNAPRWSPASLAAVSSVEVLALFDPADAPEISFID